MEGSDVFAPADTIAQFATLLRQQFPGLLPRDAAALRTDTAVVLTFARRSDGVVFLPGGAEMALGETHVVADYADVFCGACRIMRTRSAAARECPHLSRPERLERVLDRLVAAIRDAMNERS